MRYTKELKLKMIKEKRKGIHLKEVFKKFKIKVENKENDYETKTLRNWERELKNVGEEEFLREKRKKKKLKTEKKK